MLRLRRWVPFTVAMLMAVTSGIQSVEAQRSRSGFRSFGDSSRSGGGMLSVVRQESAEAELGITDEQKEKIRELRDQMRQPTPELSDLYSQLRDTSEEERAALFTKIREIQAVQRKKGEAELKKLISEKQYARLQQLTFHAQGVRALRDDDVAKDLKLDDSQKAKIKEIYEDIEKKQSEIFASMRDLPREERQKAFAEIGAKREQLRKEAETKVLAVLSDTQKQSWQKKLGPPPVALAQNGEQPKPAATTTVIRAADAKKEAEKKETTKATPATDSSKTVNADSSEEKKEVITSFSVDGKTNTKDGKPQKLSFNFQYAPWGDVIKLFADSAGLNLEINKTPPGTWTYFDKGSYTPEKALDVLNGALLQQGFILVKRDEALVVLSLDGDIPPNLIPKVSVSELPNRGKNELMSIVLPMQGLDPSAAAEEVKELLGPQGKAVALTKINRLVITDIGSNLQRVVKLLDDVPTDEGRLFRAFPLEHIAAEDAEDIVRDLFGLSARGVQNVSAAATGGTSSSRFSSSRFGSSRFQDPRFASRGSSRTPTTTSTSSRQPNSSNSSNTGDGKVNVSVDPRTNSLLVTAPPAEMKIVEQSVEAIDVKGTSTVASQRRNNEPYLEVYQLKSADATEVAKTLGVLYPGAVVNEDGRARRLHIHGTPDLHKEISAVIRRLDGQGGGSAVAAIPLGRIDSLTATATIQSLFIADRDNAPIIQPHPIGNALLVRGSSDQVEQIKTIVAQMIPQGIAAGGGPVRTLNLNGRSGEEFMRVLERMWNESETNPIRIVPSDPGPIKDRRIPSQGSSFRRRTYEEQPPAARPEKSDKKGTDTRTELPKQKLDKPNVFASVSSEEKVDAFEVAEAENLQDKAPAPSVPRKAPSKQKSPIVITLNGGNLVIASDDEEALDRLEQMFQNLAQALPARPSWTVFYLSSADATETATILERLFPTSSVSTGSTSSGGGLFGDFTSGLSSMGRGLMDMSGLSSLGTGPLTLRIIPNTRTNSLFVSGPASKVKAVEQMLEVLDESDSPEQLRQRTPRNIEVLHANVADVANIVQDVYKDYMQAQQQQNNGGQNPFAAMMGGGRGNRNNSKSASQNREVRLTLGVDTRTNMLIVSASDALFKQIQGMVRSLDDAALAANRTVRVQKVKNVNSAVLQDALVSLVPRVQVSTTGQSNNQSRSPQSRSNSQSAPQGGSDQMRQFIEQRMRDRMNQSRQGGGQPGSFSRGSSGSSPFGSRSGFGRGNSGFGRGSSGFDRSRFGSRGR